MIGARLVANMVSALSLLLRTDGEGERFQMRTGFCLAAWVTACLGLHSVCAAEFVANGSFESVQDGKLVGWELPAHYRIAEHEGMNGTRGVVYENTTDAEYYSFPAVKVDLEPGKRYTFSCWMKCEGATKAPNLAVEWYGADGHWISGSYKPCEKGSYDWREVKTSTPPIPSEAKSCRLLFCVAKGCFGKVWFDDVSLKPFERETFGGLYTSAYRNLAADGKVVFRAAINFGSCPGAKVQFAYRDAAGAERRVSPTRLTADAAILEVNAAHLALGTHPVSCELADATGRRLGGGSLDFTRVSELPKRRVWIDAKRRTIVDGKPFFPLGIYLSGVPKTAAEPLLTGPFNCVMPYNCDRAGLDFCRKHGLEVIYPLNSCWSWYEKLRPKGVTTDAEADKWIEEKVAEVKDHPALMAWYCNDEIALEHFPQLLARQKLLERIDPGHPTWAVLYQFPQVRSYYPTFDVVGTDPYPVPQSSIGNVAMWTRTTRDEVMNLKPMWQVPQAFSWGAWNSKSHKGRFPTREEMVNMTWQCVANGANGLVYWCYRLLYQNGKFRVDQWADICAAAASVKPYIPVILSDEDNPEVKGMTESLSVRAWRFQGSVYLAVVNNTRESVKGEIEVVDANATALQVLQGCDRCSLKGLGTVAVDLPGLGVSFVRIGADWK